MTLWIGIARGAIELGRHDAGAGIEVVAEAELGIADSCVVDVLMPVEAFPMGPTVAEDTLLGGVSAVEALGIASIRRPKINHR